MAPFVHRLRVRYHECDAQGVVFNANYFTWFDVTLTELWRAAFGSYGAMLERGSDVVVAEASARFLSPARFDEELEIAMAVEHLGTTSMVSDLRVRRDGDELVQGRLVHVFVDVGTHSKQAIDPEVRRALGRWAHGA